MEIGSGQVCRGKGVSKECICGAPWCLVVGRYVRMRGCPKSGVCGAPWRLVVAQYTCKGAQSGPVAIGSRKSVWRPRGDR